MNIDKRTFKKDCVSLPVRIPYFVNMYSIFFSLSSDNTRDHLRVLEEIRTPSKNKLNDIIPVIQKLLL
jgi:hypothetical protein